MRRRYIEITYRFHEYGGSADDAALSSALVIEDVLNSGNPYLRIYYQSGDKLTDMNEIWYKTAPEFYSAMSERFGAAFKLETSNIKDEIHLEEIISMKGK